jgi:aryl-alcohol dehydrogenase-like predicted oxidoreductase
MQQHAYGNSGWQVSALGLGAGQVGETRLSETDAAQLLNTALDAGITLIDTARGYGLSEERIGRHIGHRRSEYRLSTKVGYGVEGHSDWTGPIIEAGVHQALRLLRTDFIDVVHLHSCDLATLQRGDVVQALLRMQQQGHVGVAAYSGENEALAWAINSGHFAGVECSVNLFDQNSLLHTLPQTPALGVIAKRPLGNAPWRFAERPVGHYCETYWQRLHTLSYDTTGLPWDELALRFAAFAPGMSSAIVGTASVKHLLHNAALVTKGPLPPATLAVLQARFAAVGAGWPGEI